MNTLELFSGTKSFSNFFNSIGYKTFTVDNNPDLKPDLVCDILTVSEFKLSNSYDIIWASPPCTTFSVASIGTHWTGGKNAYIPKTLNAKIGLELLDKTISLIFVNNPKYWFIENPRGVMRKVIDDKFKKYGIKDYRRVTVWYCQYGDTRAKPTDIWTNLKGWEGRICKNGNKDHDSAPRGSKTGTQGLKNAKLRGVIPVKLFEELNTFLK